MIEFECISFDEKNHRFCIFKNTNGEIYFSYWLEFKKFDISYLNAGQRFLADIEECRLNLNSRGMSINKIELLPIINVSKDLIFNENISSSEFLKKVDEPDSNYLIYINCQFEDFQFRNLIINKTLVFIGCEFTENLRFVECTFTNTIWLPNCSFRKHFSFKNSVICGNLHLEGSDFSGMGGASFRGVKANNIYIDFGVEGGDDLFWFNEIEVLGVVSIGGNFHSEIQFLYKQDDSILDTLNPKIGSVIIGVEIYDYERANKTAISSQIKFDKVHITDGLLINDLFANSLSINECIIDSIDISDLSLDRDLTIKNTSIKNESNKTFSLNLINSSIGRHFKFDDNNIFGIIDFNGTAVSEVTYLENNKFDSSSSINLCRYTTSRFLINPAENLFRGSQKRFFSPRKFDLLNGNSNKLLAEQYCALKHWLADSGNLQMEDVAFFHMRQNQHPNKIMQFIFGGIFGWGVRLTNIALSSTFVIIFFSLLYWLIDNDLDLTSSISLSTQSFISSFFGKWKDFKPNELMSAVVTLESFIGVFFITVFVGSYIRKLLR